MYSRNTKTTNEPTASNNKSDRPQVKIWDTWKTLQYLNINDSFHLKDFEILNNNLLNRLKLNRFHVFDNHNYLIIIISFDKTTGVI